jgi:hypothetical protein
MDTLKSKLSNIKSKLKMIDISKINNYLNQELINIILQGNLTNNDISNLLKEYSEKNINNTYGLIANILSSNPELLKKIVNIIDFKNILKKNQAQMFNSEFENNVDKSYKDLLNYNKDDIILLAKKMNINYNNNFNKLYKEIANRIVYINSDKLPDEKDIKKCNKYRKKLNHEQIREIRNKIYNEFYIFKDNVINMVEKDIENLFYKYDDLCFQGEIFKYMKAEGYTIKFKIEGEHTFTTEGICSIKTCHYVITIPIHHFKNVKKGEITIVAGHSCKDQLDCLLRVIEHELVHLIIFIFCRDGYITDQHGPLFMNTANDLFKHTDHRHYIF